MKKLTLAAALALSLSATAAPARAAPSVAALSPYTATRLSHRPRHVRTAHCERKADSVRVQGRAREIYMRKCTSG